MSLPLRKLAAAIAMAFCLSCCTSTQTMPIQDARGQTIAGSVASLEQITLGGVSQWVLMRGQNVENPILLKLHGGPGQAEMATSGLNRLLEKDFLVVEWDQRGAGKSARAVEPESGMNIAQFVEDTRELTEILLKRFHQKKLILVGHSWGSVVGLKTVRKYPDLYRAFVSTGQIVNFSKGMDTGYRFLTDEAKSRNNSEAMNDLTRIGPPPYMGKDRKAKSDVYGKWLEEFGALWRSPEKFDRVGWMIASVEYSWPEKLTFMQAAEKSFDLLLPELAAVDMSTEVPKVDVPVFFAVGRYDHMAPFEISQNYFSKLIAPYKEWVWFENSAHFPQWEEIEKFHGLLTEKVLPVTRR